MEEGMLWDNPYIIEILTPRKEGDKPVLKEMEMFAQRYGRALLSGCAVSIPDNPLGNLRYSVLDTFNNLGLHADPGKTLINLNTFHSKEELDRMLQNAAQEGLRYLLVIRGDGSPDLPKLQPQDLDVEAKMVTSIELLCYINTRYGDVFCTGAAFNQYKPQSVERAKLEKKKSAGARFIITQPVLGEDPHITRLRNEDIPLIIEAWMSPRIDFFLKSVKGSVEGNLNGYDPVQNLRILHESYPGSCVYLSMVHSHSDWSAKLPRL